MEENQMEENQEEKQNLPSEPDGALRTLWVAIIILLCVTAVSLGYIIEQHRGASQLAGKNQELMTSLNQTKGQVDTLASKLNQMQVAEQTREREEAARQAIHTRYARAHRPAVHKDDPRWKQVESELAEHQKAINSNQQDLSNTRAQLQGNLDSTRDQLNGSIARTHDELVALEKKGERNYYEFDINKSKQFQRVGPINVSLRHTNAKHQFVNLQLLVDDKELTKKHINIYEPVVFYPDRGSQPLELVINEISKNHMHGYVSAPKYNATDLAAAASNSDAAPAPTTTPSPAPATVGTMQRRAQPLK